MKKSVLMIAPFSTRSGYGDHARSIFYSIIVYLLNKNTKSLMVPVGVGIFTIIISKNTIRVNYLNLCI